jgi:hypothetical protein
MKWSMTKQILRPHRNLRTARYAHFSAAELRHFCRLTSNQSMNSSHYRSIWRPHHCSRNNISHEFAFNASHLRTNLAAKHSGFRSIWDEFKMKGNHHGHMRHSKSQLTDNSTRGLHFLFILTYTHRSHIKFSPQHWLRSALLAELFCRDVLEQAPRG